MAYLVVAVSQEKTKTDFTLRDVLGDEFQKYYDGCGYDIPNREHHFFFNNVPQTLCNLAESRLKNHENVHYKINLTK